MDGNLLLAVVRAVDSYNKDSRPIISPDTMTIVEVRI